MSSRPTIVPPYRDRQGSARTERDQPPAPPRSTAEIRRRAQRVRGARALIAYALPHDGRLRFNLSQRPSLVSCRDPNRRATMAAARCDRDVTIYHGANAECVYRAHGVDDVFVQGDLMVRIPVGKGIGSDDPIAVEHDEVTTMEFFKLRLNGRLA